jgi:hypothetical protein
VGEILKRGAETASSSPTGARTPAPPPPASPSPIWIATSSARSRFAPTGNRVVRALLLIAALILCFILFSPMLRGWRPRRCRARSGRTSSSRIPSAAPTCCARAR